MKGDAAGAMGTVTTSVFGLAPAALKALIFLHFLLSKALGWLGFKPQNQQVANNLILLWSRLSELALEYPYEADPMSTLR